MDEKEEEWEAVCEGEASEACEGLLQWEETHTGQLSLRHCAHKVLCEEDKVRLQGAWGEIEI